MKLSLIEYSGGVDLPEEHRPLIERANKIICKSLRLSRTPLIISDGKLRALGIAGIIRLSNAIELEIVPKIFDGQVDNNWKESLFLLAALSKHGDIIANEHIHSKTNFRDSLYDIAGRVLSREYAANHRNPVRNYRRFKFYDYSVEGDIDFDLLFEKNPDGIPQEMVVFDKRNTINSTICRAMSIVLPYVKTASIRESLKRAILELGINNSLSKRRQRIPARNKEWTNIYNLSFDIVSGLGSSLDSGEIMSPSFIVDTWRVWEWLITIGMRIGVRNNVSVIPQAMIPWGVKRTNGKEFCVNVFPDVAVYDLNNKAFPLFLIDAKYKVLSHNAEIDRSDLYEAFAFCKATGSKTIMLAFPQNSNVSSRSGNVEVVSRYIIEDIIVLVITIAFGSITKQGDISLFCNTMADGVMSLCN